MKRVPASLRSLSAIVLLATTALARPAHAYRPFDGTDADVAEYGAFELEAAPLGYLADSMGPHLLVPNVVLNLGFAHDWEAVLDTVADLPLRAPATYGTAETELTLKGILHRGSMQEANDGPSAATEFGLLLPDRDDPRGAGFLASFILSQRWTALTLHWNVDAVLDRTQRPDVFTTLIVEGPHAWVVRPVGELLVDMRATGARTVTTCSALVGAIWTLTHAWTLDLAGRLASVDGLPVGEVRAGFTVSVDIPAFHPVEAASSENAGSHTTHLRRHGSPDSRP